MGSGGHRGQHWVSATSPPSPAALSPIPPFSSIPEMREEQEWGVSTRILSSRGIHG